MPYGKCGGDATTMERWQYIAEHLAEAFKRVIIAVARWWPRLLHIRHEQEVHKALFSAECLRTCISNKFIRHALLLT